MPYISASIFMQLMTILIPQMQKVQKEGASGQKKINQWTRYLTVIVTFVQAYAYVTYLKSMGDAILRNVQRLFLADDADRADGGYPVRHVAG
jgi:preprotein translocase subunit SecY